MARQKRQSVNDWEERNKRSMEGFTHETTESTRVANRRGYDRYLQWKAQKEQKERDDIISRINDFASRSSQFASEARKRSGTDRYRTDSQDWLTSSQERSDSMRQEAKEIGDLLFQIGRAHV